jgi:hypothetical protein
MPRGGARAGAGRPRADGTSPNAYDPGEPSEDQANFDKERAAHERVKREQREFKLAIEMGQYLPRAEVQQASATALAVLAQSLRTIPDVLERSCNLTPEHAEIAQKSVDAALSEVAKAFGLLAGEGG